MDIYGNQNPKSFVTEMRELMQLMGDLEKLKDEKKKEEETKAKDKKKKEPPRYSVGMIAFWLILSVPFTGSIAALGFLYMASTYMAALKAVIK